MTLETTAWDAVQYLETPLAEFEYIRAAFEDGSPELIVAAVGDVARARGLAQVARNAGLSGESLAAAFGTDGKPTFGTMLLVLQALGLELQPEPAKQRERV